MNFIIMFESIGHFLTQSALAGLGKINLVMILIAIEDMLKINCLVRDIEGYCNDCDQVMQLRRLELSRASFLAIICTIPAIGYET